jgi:hypothetical protein
MGFGLFLPNPAAMKTQLLRFALFFFCASCTVPKFYFQRVNNIPTKSPNFDVAVYMQGEKVPERPYFEIIDIYMAEKGKLDKNTILKKIEFEAIKEGVDAVIEVEYWNQHEEIVNALTIFVDLFDEDGETTYMNQQFTHIKGVGIKYLENIDYIDELPEFEYVYLLDPETGFPNPYFKIEYTLTGQEHMVYPEVKGAVDIYKKYFQFYSDYHLLHQRDGWTYVKKNGLVTRRMMVNDDGLTVKKCIPKYDLKGKLTSVTIVHVRDGIGETEKVIYHFDESGNKIGRTVITHQKARIFEQYVFDEERLTNRKIRISIPGKENYLFNTSIVYYSADYLEKYYENEYDAKRQGFSQQ